MAERLQKFVKSYHERGQNDSVNKVQISWLLNSNKFWTVVAVVTSLTLNTWVLAGLLISWFLSVRAWYELKLKSLSHSQSISDPSTQCNVQS